VAEEGGDLEGHPACKDGVNDASGNGRVERMDLGYILRVGELKRVDFVLQDARQGVEWFTKSGMYAHENRIRNDGLGLSRSGSRVIIIVLVPGGRKSTWCGERRRPIGQAGSRPSLQCEDKRGQKDNNSNPSHIGSNPPRVLNDSKDGINR